MKKIVITKDNIKGIWVEYDPKYAPGHVITLTYKVVVDGHIIDGRYMISSKVAVVWTMYDILKSLSSRPEFIVDFEENTTVSKN